VSKGQTVIPMLYHRTKSCNCTSFITVGVSSVVIPRLHAIW